MAYDERLAVRLSQIVAGRRDMHQQKMFGGLGFLVRGNMCFGIWKDSLILRLGPEEARKALTRKYVRPFDITGRPMSGWVLVSPGGVKTGASLKRWVGLAVDFVLTLPRK